MYRSAGALICIDEGVMSCRRTILQSANKAYKKLLISIQLLDVVKINYEY